MRKNRLMVRAFGMAAVFMLVACMAAAAADTAANVAGAWNFKISGDAGSADQTIVIQQDGGKITGTFKGPKQSGTLTGTVDGNNIKFHVKARADLDYTGTVNGETMKGTMTGRGKTADFTATRAK